MERVVMAGPGHGPEEPLSTPRKLIRGFIARRLTDLRRLHSRRSEAEVFPWMEHSAAAIAVVGAVAAYGLGRGMTGLILCAIAGAFGGIWLALGWASGATRNEPGPTSRTSDLWDPWLDETRDDAVEGLQFEDVVESDDGIFLGRARVRPRVYSDESGESLPLEDEIGPIFAAHERGAIRVSGPDGSGKSTALTHLARLMPPHLQVTFWDEPDPMVLSEASTLGRVVFTSDHPISPKPLADLKLALWDEDEWIEYLLAGDRDLCASVMARLAQREAERDLLEGIPELWRIVLDQMAANESIEGPRQALRVEFDHCLADQGYRKLIEGDCLDFLVMRGKSSTRQVDRLRRHDPDEALFRMIRHRAVQLLLAADRMVDVLAEGSDCRFLAGPIPRDLVREAALRIIGRPEARARLLDLIAGQDETIQPMAASLLHSLQVGWRPGKPTPSMKGAYLDEASWAGVVLVDLDIRGVCLSRADLWGARFDGSRLEKAQLAFADLRNASLRAAEFRGADLSGARLSKVRAEEAGFESARLDGADFEDAVLDRAIFRDANLSSARLAGASLIGADLSRARFEGADFSRANLSDAVIRGLKLTDAQFEGARFARADLSQSDLEGMKLPNANFEGADFTQAMLTGASMPGANFRGACLRAAGLADVEWERADLRRADLRDAAFHLGSSRSGLVTSPIACEGSRTGFYTDDYNDQDFKSPEEIRKANLQEVDLRGAILDGVDFYLVDLRGAKVDPAHLVHLRRCGAILESRA
jgi:uncharacterized protein YjbI with pentapeptide repeats/energy-coupling factor transporter ATP-binding protein EcfA2